MLVRSSSSHASGGHTTCVSFPVDRCWLLCSPFEKNSPNEEKKDEMELKLLRFHGSLGLIRHQRCPVLCLLSQFPFFEKGQKWSKRTRDRRSCREFRAHKWSTNVISLSICYFRPLVIVAPYNDYRKMDQSDDDFLMAIHRKFILKKKQHTNCMCVGIECRD